MRFFFQTVCLTQRWKCYQKGVMESRDAKSLSLAGILEVHAYLEWQNTLMSAMHVVRANAQSFSSPHFCLQRHTRVHIWALSLPKYPLPFDIGSLWHRHTQYVNNPLGTATPNKDSGLKGFLLQKMEPTIKYQVCSSTFLRNTIQIRVSSPEFTCNRARKNNLALPGISAGKTVQHNWSTVYKPSPETWFMWAHLQLLPHRGVSLFMEREVKVYEK